MSIHATIMHFRLKYWCFYGAYPYYTYGVLQDHSTALMVLHEATWLTYGISPVLLVLRHWGHLLIKQEKLDYMKFMILYALENVAMR